MSETGGEKPKQESGTNVIRLRRGGESHRPVPAPTLTVQEELAPVPDEEALSQKAGEIAHRIIKESGNKEDAAVAVYQIPSDSTELRARLLQWSMGENDDASEAEQVAWAEEYLRRCEHGIA